MRPPSLARSVMVLLAAFCAVVLHQNVYDDFERQRVQTARGQRPDTQGTITIQLDDLSELAVQPVALVLRLANRRPTARIVNITVDGTWLADVPLQAHRETRVDLSLPPHRSTSTGQHLVLSSDDDEWLLRLLEVGNSHGFSRGLFEFVLLPASAPAPDQPGTLASFVLLVLLLTFPSIPGTLKNTYLRYTYRMLAVIFLLFLATVSLAPWLSDFAILLADHTFIICVAVLYAPTLPKVASVVTSAARDGLTFIWARRPLMVYVAAFALFITSIAAVYDPATGMTGLIRFGDHLADTRLPAVRAIPHAVVHDSFGYDGQFYAQLSIDPLLRDLALRDALDTPAYRARRILFSWSAFLLGLGQPAWILQAYAIQFVALWVLLGWVLCRWFPPTDFRNAGRWLGCMFSHGVIISVISALPDAASIFLLCLGILALERGHDRRCAAVISVAGLAKATNLLLGTVLLTPNLLQRRDWRTLCTWGFVVAGPLFLWMAYVAGQLDLDNLGGGRNFSAPLTGYVEKWYVALGTLAEEGWASYQRFSLYVLISLTVQAAVLLFVRDWRDAWWRAGMGSLLLMTVLGSAVWEGAPGAATRVVLPMTFAFNMMLPQTRWFWPLWLLGNLSILPALEVLRVPFWWYL